MRRGVKLAIGIPMALVGALMTLAGFILLAFVGVDGTFTTPTTSAITDTHAIVISASFVGEDFRSDDLGESSVTLDVTGGGGDVFVGVGDTADVAAYLDGVAHAEATEVSYPGGDLELRPVGGTDDPTPPAEERFWTTSRTGDGELTWPLNEGDWSLVVMNVDGTAGVNVAGTATARIPVLGTALAVLLVIGVPLVVGGLAMIVSALRGDDRSGRGPTRTASAERTRPRPPTVPIGTVPPRPDVSTRRPDS